MANRYCLLQRGQFATKKFINYNKSQIEEWKFVNNAILANGGDGNANYSHNQHTNFFAKLNIMCTFFKAFLVKEYVYLCQYAAYSPDKQYDL